MIFLKWASLVLKPTVLRVYHCPEAQVLGWFAFLSQDNHGVLASSGCYSRIA
jgi:hypothetical protein